LARLSVGLNEICPLPARLVARFLEGDISQHSYEKYENGDDRSYDKQAL